MLIFWWKFLRVTGVLSWIYGCCYHILISILMSRVASHNIPISGNIDISCTDIAQRNCILTNIRTTCSDLINWHWNYAYDKANKWMFAYLHAWSTHSWIFYGVSYAHGNKKYRSAQRGTTLHPRLIAIQSSQLHWPSFLAIRAWM